QSSSSKFGNEKVKGGSQVACRFYRTAKDRAMEAAGPSRSASAPLEGDCVSQRRAFTCRRKIFGTIERVWGSLSGSIRCVARTRSVRRHERDRIGSELYQRAKRFRTRYPTSGIRWWPARSK